jgi:catechol 2,3-dioxygenase-like lactoylglutathione lyase family enzyme
MLRGFATINYWADDLDAAKRWYTELLGVEPYFERPGPDGRPAYAEFRIGGYQHELGLVDRRWMPSGAAKTDGRWDAAYASQHRATVPDDLAAALTQDERARAFFESLGRTDRYGVILRLLKARTPAIRAAQLRRIVARLRAGQRGG